MSNSIEQEVTHVINNLDAELRKISLKVNTVTTCLSLAPFPLTEVSDWQIHDNPELSYEEVKAHDLLTDYLEQKGFVVTRHASGLNTGFIAEYSNGPGRRVGFCSEYDALPG